MEFLLPKHDGFALLSAYVFLMLILRFYAHLAVSILQNSHKNNVMNSSFS